MSPEKDSNTWMIIAGFLATLYGGALTFIYTMQGKRARNLEEAQKGFVTDKTSRERFAHVAETLKEVKEQTEKQWEAITDTGKEVAGMSAQLGLFIENFQKKGKGDL